MPFLAFESDRDTLVDWADRKGPDGLEAYQAERNASSIDGLNGLAGLAPEPNAPEPKD